MGSENRDRLELYCWCDKREENKTTIFKLFDRPQMHAYYVESYFLRITLN